MPARDELFRAPRAKAAAIVGGVVALFAGLSACASLPSAPEPQVATPACAERAAGMASWYGPNLQGNPTANGERFDQNALTAAHRTLPLPSLVRVTNLANGRDVVVRVNDRGPYAEGRLIDVSRAAAQKLDFVSDGETEVALCVLGPVPEQPA
ncbi:MAG: septal ring lytic transglycosylase RlpA family protein [Alphaproteobacteria bacterium]|nr:septal ring lytic transglycosylase RlpA family protein [Alphaproteobacteria bacterium]